MKRCAAVGVIFALVAWASVANASITGVTAADDGDGVITCTTVWSQLAAELSIDGTHNIFDAGHVLGTITTDSPMDPILTIVNSMVNDTGIEWIGYHINISMPVQFYILNEAIYVPADWSVTLANQPVLVGSNYVGQLDYTAGTPVADGGTIEFGYAIELFGFTSYSFTQEMIPVSVPEPGTFVLATGGLLVLFALRRRSA